MDRLDYFFYTLLRNGHLQHATIEAVVESAEVTNLGLAHEDAARRSPGTLSEARKLTYRLTGMSAVARNQVSSLTDAQVDELVAEVADRLVAEVAERMARETAEREAEDGGGS